MLESKTLGEHLQAIGDEIKQNVLLAPDPMAINLTNVKSMIAEMLTQFGPFLVKLLIAMLQPKEN